VLSSSLGNLLLRVLQPQLKQLLLLKQADGTDMHISAEEIQEHVLEAPASWLLPVRDIQPVASVKVDWEVDMGTIKQTAQDCFSQKRLTILLSPTSCLLGGVKWCMRLRFEWDASKQGVRIKLFAHPRNLPAGSLRRCTYRLQCVGLEQELKGSGGRKLFSELGWGSSDFFEVGSMSGAWMQVAGLPRGCQHQAAFCCG
jgi:hypothetical protein